MWSKSDIRVILAPLQKRITELERVNVALKASWEERGAEISRLTRAKD